MTSEPDDRADGPWTDGWFPHPRCGRYVEDHRLVYKKRPDGTARSQWECPVGYPS